MLLGLYFSQNRKMTHSFQFSARVLNLSFSMGSNNRSKKHIGFYVFTCWKVVDLSEAVAWRCSVTKVFLKISQNSLESICARVSFFAGLRSATLLKKETLTLVSSYEFSSEIFKNTFF